MYELIRIRIFYQHAFVDVLTCLYLFRLFLILLLILKNCIDHAHFSKWRGFDFIEMFFNCDAILFDDFVEFYKSWCNRQWLHSCLTKIECSIFLRSQKLIDEYFLIFIQAQQFFVFNFSIQIFSVSDSFFYFLFSRNLLQRSKMFENLLCYLNIWSLIFIDQRLDDVLYEDIHVCCENVNACRCF